jgi:hypothetical protein
MRLYRTALRALPLSVLSLVAIGSSAGAQTFCVRDSACVLGGGVDEPTIAAAIDAARALDGGDRIQLGPGTFEETQLTVGAASTVEIVGAGVDRTVIAPPDYPSQTALIVRSPGSSVSDLSFALPARSAVIAIRAHCAIRRVAVTAPPGMFGNGVVLFGSGSFADGTVVLPTGGGTIGVQASSADVTPTVERSTIAAYTGILNVGTVRHVRVTARQGIDARAVIGTVEQMTIDDALVQLVPGTRAVGLRAKGETNGQDSIASIVARHVTVIGNGEDDSVGVAAIANHTSPYDPYSASATATISDTILYALGTDVQRSASGGSATTATAHAAVAVDYSKLDPASVWSFSQAGATGSLQLGPHNLNVDPGFADPAGGDFSLPPGSALVDRGSPAPLEASEPPIDLAGNARIADGDGDGVAVRDMGAFELGTQPLKPVPPPVVAPRDEPPRLTALALRPARFTAAHGTRIHFALSRPAHLSFVVERRVAGRRAGRACVRPARAPRRARRCRRYVRVLAFDRDAIGGQHTLRFRARRPRGPLAPGAYRLLARVGASSSAPRIARFTILPPRT